MQAHGILQTPDQELQNHLLTLGKWADTAPNTSPETDILHQHQRMYQPGETIPGTLTPTAVQEVNTILEFTHAFTENTHTIVISKMQDNPNLLTLARNPDQAQQEVQLITQQNLPAIRQGAVEVFNSSLEAATTIEQIADLITTARPFIDYHKNDILDMVIGLENTSTWNTCLKAARNKALEFLKDKMQATGNNSTTTPASDSLDASITALKGYRSQPLFAAHRNLWFKGGWGRTQAQREIDTLLSQLKTQKKSR